MARLLAAGLVLVALLCSSFGSARAAAGAEEPAPAAPAAPPTPGTAAADPDAPILKALASEDVTRAAALADAAFARDAADPGLTPGARAAHIEKLAPLFYGVGTADAVSRSERLYERVLALREQEAGSQPAALASTLCDFSALLYNRGAYERAEALKRRALEIQERVLGPSDPVTAGTRRDLGVVLLAQGRLAEADASLAPAMAVLENAPGVDWTEVALGLNGLAELRRQQGDYESAEKIFSDLARDAEKKMGASDANLPFFLNNLAGIYRDLERYDEAETLLRRSLDLRRRAKSPDPYVVARAELNLAELYRWQEKFDEAEPLYTSALADARKGLGPDHPELLEFQSQLAVLYRDEGQLARAEPPQRAALALAERGFGPDSYHTAQNHLDLARLLRMRGRWSAARPHLDRAIAIREKAFGPDHPDVAEALVESAACRPRDVAGRRAAGAELERAIAILQRSDAYPTSQIEAFEARARLLRSTDPAAAGRDLGEALGVVEKMRPHRGGGESVRASFLGKYRRLYDLAVRWDVEDGRTESALATAEKGRARVLLDQLAAAGVADASARDPEMARRLTEARGRLAETREQLLYQQSREDLPVKERAASVAALERRLTDDARAFRELRDQARNTSAAWRSATHAPPLSLTGLQREIVPGGGWLLFYQVGDERSYLFAVPGSGAAQVVELKAGATDAAALGIAAGPVNAASLRRVLLGARGTAAAEPRPGLLAALASARTVVAAPAARAGAAVRGIGGITTGASPEEAALRALARVLVPGPLWGRIRGASQVLVVPDDALFLLPFEALVVSSGAESARAKDVKVAKPVPAGVRYWIDDGPVVRYAPSATFLAQIAGREAARGEAAAPAERPRALSVADPAYGVAAPVPPSVVRAPGASGGEGPAERSLRGGALARLPGTAHESDLVREALAGVADVLVLRGAEAREPAVRAELSGKRYLHIATHALVDQEGGDLFAALALTPPPSGSPRGDDDGFLQLFEIYDLRMDCELAVLSSCSSNIGRVVAGEGIFALSRGFLLGGARRVIASQWAVDDVSTADLVGDLFQRLAADEASGEGADPARALRDAKRTVRRRAATSQPFYWAPFVITGVR